MTEEINVYPNLKKTINVCSDKEHAKAMEFYQKIIKRAAKFSEQSDTEIKPQDLCAKNLSEYLLMVHDRIVENTKISTKSSMLYTKLMKR